MYDGDDIWACEKKSTKIIGMAIDHFDSACRVICLYFVCLFVMLLYYAVPIGPKSLKHTPYFALLYMSSFLCLIFFLITSIQNSEKKKIVSSIQCNEILKKMRHAICRFIICRV